MTPRPSHPINREKRLGDKIKIIIERIKNSTKIWKRKKYFSFFIYLWENENTAIEITMTVIKNNVE